MSDHNLSLNNLAQPDWRWLGCCYLKLDCCLRWEMAGLLLSQGAKQTPDVWGNFPLHAACVTGNKYHQILHLSLNSYTFYNLKTMFSSSFIFVCFMRKASKRPTILKGLTFVGTGLWSIFCWITSPILRWKMSVRSLI